MRSENGPIVGFLAIVLSVCILMLMFVVPREVQTYVQEDKMITRNICINHTGLVVGEFYDTENPGYFSMGFGYYKPVGGGKGRMVIVEYDGGKRKIMKGDTLLVGDMTYIRKCQMTRILKSEYEKK